MWFRLYILIFLIVSAALPASADVKDGVAALAPNALVFVLDKDGNELVSQNANDDFVPASVAKIATAWFAMEVLGSDHRFETRFYLDDKRVLYVRGGGDPFLVSEELALLAPKLLAKTGKEPFTAMVLDTSYYPDNLRIPGVENTDRSYDARNSALAVNFNTINAVRNGKSVKSAEEQTPITPLAISQFLERAPNGRSRISLAQGDPAISSLYAGELLAAFIEKSGGKIEGKISIGSIPANLQTVFVHRQSRDLPEILRAMLLGSNNYITNQVFLEVGAHKLGGPVSLEKSLKVTGEILAKHGLSDSIRMVEGSGISRDNKFTALGLAKLLDQFAPHAELLRKSKKGSRYKTGTLSNVKTLAGYAKTTEHGLVRFVISLRGGSGKMRFRLLNKLESAL
ncbi:MAG: D-alanyl-D-alanine carboxypeptidase [Pseudomonadota bacterium]